MPTSTATELELPVIELPPVRPAPAPVTAPSRDVTPVAPDRYREMWESLPPADRARYADTAEGRLADIKPYQLEGAALTAFKRSAINGYVMGAGKTLMAIFHAYAINANRTAVIVPTRLIPTWQRECQRVRVPCVVIENATDARRVRRELWLARKRGLQATFTFYVISWEWLSLGGESNRVVDPWYAALKVDELHRLALTQVSAIAARLYRLSPGGVFEKLTPDIATGILAELDAQFEASTAAYAAMSTIDRLRTVKPVNCSKGIRALFDLQLLVHSQREAAIAAGETPPLPFINFDLITERDERWNTWQNTDVGVKILCEGISAELLAGELRRMGVPLKKGQSYRYEAHHKVCPKCSAKTPDWKGTHCTNPECRYEPRAYLGNLIDERGQPREVTTRAPGSKERFKHRTTRSSNRSTPGYKLLPKFDLKVVEEFHKAVSLHTLHGLAIFDVDATDTLLLSGTICRSYITELEPALALVHDENSPEFPYARYDLSDFRSRFGSNATRYNILRPERPTIIARTTIPEASNINALRRILLQRMVTVDEAIVDAEWGLRPTPEHTVVFSLLPAELERYQSTLDSVLSWRRQLMDMIQDGDSTEQRIAQTALMRGARNRLDLVAAITNGPSKVAAAVAWVRREAIEGGHRSIVACRSVAFFDALEKAFRAEGFDIAVCDTTVGNEERDEFLTQFAESSTRILLTRIKLVCEGFNQLVCCTRELMCEVERSPSDNRQFQKRFNRPGQRRPNDIRCDLLVARLPSGEASIDEIDIRRFLRKERAVKDVTGRQARFRGAAALLEASQQARGLLLVLEDLAARVLTETAPELPAIAIPSPAPAELSFGDTAPEPTAAGSPISEPMQPAIVPTSAEPTSEAPATDFEAFDFDTLFAQVPSEARPSRTKSPTQPKSPLRTSYVQAELF